MLRLYALIVSLAILDSISPFKIAIAVYLLATPKPLARTFSYALGIFVTYFIMGLLFHFGLDRLVGQLFEMPRLVEYLIGMGIGAVLVAFGVYTLVAPVKHRQPHPYLLSLGVIATFCVGVAMTVITIPSVAPYVAAINVMVKHHLSIFGILIALAVYNFLYVLPILGTIGIYLVAGERAHELLQQLLIKVIHWGRYIAGSLFIVFGVLLFADGIGFLFGHPFL